MKTACWLALLLLLGPLVAHAQNSPGLKSEFKVQREVLYPIDTALFEASLAWYTKFFGQAPDSVQRSADYPSAVFYIDGTRVRLATDPKYIELKQTVFYWMLPGPDDVKEKFRLLDSTPGTRFNRSFLRRQLHLGGIRLAKRRPYKDEADRVETVSGFIVFDPSGNEVGVINNPIYPPRK